MTTQPMTLNQIRNLGMEALMKALGPVGMVRFLQQFDIGKGDYSTERHNWLTEENIDILVQKIEKKRKLKK